MSARLTIYSKISKDGKFYLADGRKLSVKIVLDFGLSTKYDDCLMFHYKIREEPISLTYKHCIAEALYRWNNLILSGVE